MNNKRKLIIIITSALIAGILFGWLIFGNPGSKSTDEHDHNHDTEISGETTWTCSMHPQIRQPEPGDCPICGMDLIPLENEEDENIDPMAISMSPTAMKLANVSTALVGSKEPVKTVRLNGKVQSDERLVYSQSSHIPGRIEKLMVNFTGEYVRKGAVIATVYAPDLVTAQEELFEAQKIMDTQPQLFNAAKEKLKNWKLSESQIEDILQSGTASENFEIRADISGYVTRKRVNTGDYIQKGEAIYEIADLSRVWILFDVYESDISWVKRGDQVSFTVASLPGEEFNGTISYLDPVIDSKTRVAKARVEFSNRSLKLKPEMFVSGIVQARLDRLSHQVVVSKSAVMWTGKRSIVYIKSTTDQGVNFMMREVTLGPSLGDSYIIESGLEEGEEIAVSGTFSIDASAQLAGKSSMMSPEGGRVSTGHDHGSMTTDQPEGGASVEKETITKAEDTPETFKKQLTVVYQAYLDMKDAFVASDATEAGKKAGNVSEALARTDMGLLKGDAHMTWMDQLATLEETLSAIQKSSDIEEQRKAFTTLNQVLYKSLKTFGLSGVETHYQYCPMANNDQGGYWFSNNEEIKNPYFGDAMLGCGENKEMIK